MANKSFKNAKKPLVASAPTNPPATVNPLAKPAQNSQPTSLSKGMAPETRAAKPSVKATPAAAPPRITAAETPQTPPMAAVGEQATARTATQNVNVTLALLEPGAKQVFLCGEFNGWAPDATPMKRDDAGRWETTLALAPGRHEYKFCVDGNWKHDPLAHVNVWNKNGTLNSVAQVRG